MDKIAQHSCASVEHWTPDYIIEAARKTMGGIDIDPASCLQAQETVRAKVWYGRGSEHGVDGLSVLGMPRRWLGRGWLNPPGGALDKSEYDPRFKTKSRAVLWWCRYVTEWEAGRLTEAHFMGFTLELLSTTQGLGVRSAMSFPYCVPQGRTDFETYNRTRTTGKKAGELIDKKKPAGARVKQGGPAHANVVVYLPARTHGHPNGAMRFRDNFASIGECKL